MDATSETKPVPLTIDDSPSIRYFDLLPPELINDIVGSFEDIDHQDRQRTLHSLCLTSKKFATFARPLLFTRVDTSFRYNVLPLLIDNNSDKSLALVKTLNFGPSGSEAREDFKLLHLQKLATVATRLRTVNIYWSYSVLKPFIGTNITTLSLGAVRFETQKVFCFPQLVRLCIQNCYLGDNFRCDLPKLKHFVYSGFYDSPPNRDESEFVLQVAPSLISLTTNDKMLQTLPSSILSLPTLSILTEAGLDESFTSGSFSPTNPNLCLVVYQDPDTFTPRPQVVDKLREWARRVEDLGGNPETLTFVIAGGEQVVDEASCERWAKRLIEDFQSVCPLPSLTTAIRIRWTLAFEDTVPDTFLRVAERRYQAYLDRMENDKLSEGAD